jgi:hypothetical protein
MSPGAHSTVVLVHGAWADGSSWSESLATRVSPTSIGHHGYGSLSNQIAIERSVMDHAPIGSTSSRLFAIAIHPFGYFLPRLVALWLRCS